MTKRYKGYTMEALALVSALCIVAIFVFSHVTREADRMDKRAWRLAKALQPVAEAVFTDNQQAKLDLQTLTAKGVEVPKPLKVEVPQDYNLADNWQVWVWHPDGLRRYEVTSKDVKEVMR